MTLVREEARRLLLATQLLTRLPVRISVEADAARSGAAARYYPVVGAALGALAGAVFWVAHLALPIELALVISTAATLLVTGAFHEDGFADACDGLGGGATRERVLEIMRDSRLGTYGVAGLGLMLAAKILSLAAVPPSAIPWLLIAAHAASRSSAVLALATGTYAREDGMARPVSGRVGAGSLALALGFGAMGFVMLWFLIPMPGLLAGLAGLAAGHLAMRAVYERRLGGYTGDCLGGVQQTSELGLYLGVAAAL